MTCTRYTVRSLRVGLGVLICALAAEAQTTTLTFENVFGPCGDNSLVMGPSTFTIQGVTFTMGPQFGPSYNVGKDYANNPFDSDSCHIWAYGSGAILDFHQPILALSFLTGDITPKQTYPTFELIANGQVVTTFGQFLSTVTSVSVTFPTSVSQVALKFVSGSGGLLGLDDLTFTPGIFTPYCFGDGLDSMVNTICPCFNFGTGGGGCANSGNPAGASLSATGAVSPADTIVFTSSGELPSALSTLIQSSSNTPGGIVFGSGVRCLSGTLLRLFTHNAVSGSMSAPQGGDLTVSSRSAQLGDPLSPGSVRYYAVYYRDPSTTFCPVATFNVSNGFSLSW